MGMASPLIDARMAAALLAGPTPELRLSCLWTLTPTGSGFKTPVCCANVLGTRLNMVARTAAHKTNLLRELFMDETPPHRTCFSGGVFYQSRAQSTENCPGPLGLHLRRPGARTSRCGPPRSADSPF